MHDPEKWKPVFPRDKRGAFARRSCSNKRIPLESDSTQCIVSGAAVLWCLRTIVHAVIADHTGDAQPVVFEDRRTALALGLAVLCHIAPCRNGSFIAEK